MKTKEEIFELLEFWSTVFKAKYKVNLTWDYVSKYDYYYPSGEQKDFVKIRFDSIRVPTLSMYMAMTPSMFDKDVEDWEGFIERQFNMYYIGRLETLLENNHNQTVL